MTKPRKNVIGARIDDEINDALKRLAAARGASQSSLCSDILTEYVTRLQTTGAEGVWDEVSHQFDERLAEHGRRLMQEINAVFKALKREITVLKAQIDMLLECTAPEQRAAYQQGVAKLIQTNGIVR